MESVNIHARAIVVTGYVEGFETRIRSASYYFFSAVSI